MNKNTESTRYYSDKQEKSVCKLLGANQSPNSGAGKFRKGDVFTESFLIECKTCMKDKDSFSIKKDWIIKNKAEAFTQRKSNQAIAFNFGPDQENYFVINEKLMKYLIEKLREEDD